MQIQTTRPSRSGWYWVSDSAEDGEGAAEWRIVWLDATEDRVVLVGFVPEVVTLGDIATVYRFRECPNDSEISPHRWRDMDWLDATYSGPERWCGPIPTPPGAEVVELFGMWNPRGKLWLGEPVWLYSDSDDPEELLKLMRTDSPEHPMLAGTEVQSYGTFARVGPSAIESQQVAEAMDIKPGDRVVLTAECVAGWQDSPGWVRENALHVAGSVLCQTDVGDTADTDLFDVRWDHGYTSSHRRRDLEAASS